MAASCWFYAISLLMMHASAFASTLAGMGEMSVHYRQACSASFLFLYNGRQYGKQLSLLAMNALEDSIHTKWLNVIIHLWRT